MEESGLVHGTEREFFRLRKMVNSLCGIKMPQSKNSMLWARLQKRIRNSRVNSIEEYCDLLAGEDGEAEELHAMIDAVTTHKTDFFREPSHFDVLSNKVLPELTEKGAGQRRPLSVWSIGCSTGEEPYSIAMTLQEYAAGCDYSFRYGILATDISVKVLDAARLGIYTAQKITAVPANLQKNYLLRNRENKELYRAAPSLREKIRFRVLNLMDEDYGLDAGFDVVFFRNVLIYFDRFTQEKIINRIAGHMQPGAYLFVGHSETLHDMNVPLCQTVATVYRRI